MNSNLASEQASFAPDPKNNDNSVNYLRRLKAETNSEAPSKPHPVAGGQTPPYPRDRRRSPRFRCTGSLGLTDEATQSRMWGTLTDISLRGCYVEMSSTLPVDSKVALVMDISGIRIRSKGIVRISYPGLGMGIMMTGLAAEEREHLEQLLANLAHATASASPQFLEPKTTVDALATIDPTFFVHELQQFFARNTNLSHEEFLRMAERCRRP